MPRQAAIVLNSFVPRADRHAINEPTCDRCGQPHKALRRFNRERFCLVCYAQVKFPE